MARGKKRYSFHVPQVAFENPIRKLQCNLTITFVSVLGAFLVGGIEVVGLAVEELGLKGPLWRYLRGLNANRGSPGYLKIAVIVVSWLASMLFTESGDRMRLTSLRAETGAGRYPSTSCLRCRPGVPSAAARDRAASTAFLCAYLSS